MIGMDAPNPSQNKVLNESRDLSHSDNKNKDVMQFHLLFLQKEH